jgi:hypothetical protein
LSRMTICPGVSVGASSVRTYATKTAPLVAPCMVMAGPMPVAVRLAISVVAVPRLRATQPTARSPHGARP